MFFHYSELKRVSSLVLLFCLLTTIAAWCQEAKWPSKTLYRFAEVKGHRMFYREAGDRKNPTIILLHGYPSSSHTYREIIPLLSGRYHVIAPDNLGSGYSDKPDPALTHYTFDLLAEQVEGLLEVLDIDKYTLYIQDFGAPVGFRMMMNRPRSLQALIVQNGNAYLEGLTPKRQRFFRQAQLDTSSKMLDKLFQITGSQSVKATQYLRDVKGREYIMSPDSWTHDNHFLEQKQERDIQVALFQDYKTNLDNYHLWQSFLRKHQPPTLLVWGRHDPAFLAAGAEAYLQDVSDAELHLLDAGHFAAEEKPVDIAKFIVTFLEKISLRL